MPIEIKVTADTAEEARELMARLAMGASATLTYEVTTVREEVAAENGVASQSALPETPAPAPAPEEKPAAKKAKPKKAEAPAPAPVVADAPVIEEPEQVKPADATLTLDDVRNALGEYVKVYGMAAAQEDGTKVLKMLFGEAVSNMSGIPATQEALRKTIDGVREMTAKNPYKRTPVAKAAA